VTLCDIKAEWTAVAFIENDTRGPGALGIDLEALANLPSLACLAAWDHGKLNASFEQDGEVQALYREAAGFDQSQGKTVR
jgi:hypothetical protein